jgi:hypothetical protein
MGPGLKNHVLLNAPVMALLVTTTIMAIGLAVVAWYWFLVPNGSVEVLGQPALVRKGDYYEACIAVRNSGRDAVVVYGLEVESGKCIIETGNNIKPGESLVIEARCSINPDPGTSVVKGVLLTTQGSYPVVFALV